MTGNLKRGFNIIAVYSVYGEGPGAAARLRRGLSVPGGPGPAAQRKRLQDLARGPHGRLRGRPQDGQGQDRQEQHKLAS